MSSDVLRGMAHRSNLPEGRGTWVEPSWGAWHVGRTLVLRFMVIGVRNHIKLSELWLNQCRPTSIVLWVSLWCAQNARALLSCTSWLQLVISLLLNASQQYSSSKHNCMMKEEQKVFLNVSKHGGSPFSYSYWDRASPHLASAFMRGLRYHNDQEWREKWARLHVN